MATFQEAQNRAKKITRQQAKDDFLKFFRSVLPLLVEANQTNLLIESEDIFGNPIGFYSKATEEITGGRKKEGEPFDLFETGEFLAGFFAEMRGDEAIFDTSDSKKGKVIAQTLSKDLFGVQDKDLKKVIDEKLRPFLQKYYKALL